MALFLFVSDFGRGLAPGVTANTFPVGKPRKGGNAPLADCRSNQFMRVKQLLTASMYSFRPIFSNSAT